MKKRMTEKDKNVLKDTGRVFKDTETFVREKTFKDPRGALK